MTVYYPKEMSGGRMSRWERAFDELLSARGHALSAYAFLLCGDAAESSDFVQEALLRVFARLRAGDDIASLEAYTRRVILNLCLEDRRRHGRWRSKRHLFVASLTEASLEEQLSQQGMVRDAMSVLSPKQRACVVLRFYEDLPVTAIADELSCSEGAVKRHLADAKTRLAERLRLTPEESV
jgi:RNA polymerase sigma factor (sigma-70 family)